MMYAVGRSERDCRKHPNLVKVGHFTRFVVISDIKWPQKAFLSVKLCQAVWTAKVV
jgi:hypothetical protein